MAHPASTTERARDLSGRHVVVTGGTGALGRAVVQAFLEAGATCHVPHRGAAPRDRAGADAAPPAASAAGGRLRYVAGVELSDEAAVAAFYAGLPAPLWASVHAAGGWAGAPLVKTSLADLRAQLDQNLVSCFLCCREAVKRMDGGGGRIVNVASRAAVEPKGGAAAYAVAKAGVVALTRALADELRDAEILVNAVLPSTIDTPANRNSMPGPPEAHARWAPPAHIAAAILWLASTENRLTSGAALPVYGRS